MVTVWILVCIGFIITAYKIILLHAEQPLLWYSKIFVNLKVLQQIFIEFLQCSRHCSQRLVDTFKVLLLLRIMFWSGRDRSNQASNEMNRVISKIAKFCEGKENYGSSMTESDEDILKGFSEERTDRSCLIQRKDMSYGNFRGFCKSQGDRLWLGQPVKSHAISETHLYGRTTLWWIQDQVQHCLSGRGTCRETGTRSRGYNLNTSEASRLWNQTSRFNSQLCHLL